MLSRSKDPMGHAIYDYYHNKPLSILRVECSIAADDEIPIPYLFREYEEFPNLEQVAMKYCKGRILDVGIGAGCHCAYLMSQGFEVLGIDISELAVEVCKEKGIAVKAISIYDLNEEGYDTILLLMNGLGIVGDFGGLDRFFQKAKGILNPGGQILVESSDIKYMFEEEDGSFKIPFGTKFYGELEYRMSYNNIEGDAFPWLYLPFELLEDHAKKHGFGIERLFEDDSHAYLAKITLSK